MKKVGRRKESKITFNSTSENLKNSAAFGDSMNRFFDIKILIPKGVYYYKTHRDADIALRKYIVKSMVDKARNKVRDK